MWIHGFKDGEGELLHHSTMSDLHSTLTGVEPEFEKHKFVAYIRSSG
jgi:hypothetical protein